MKQNIATAEVVLPCTELDETLSFYTEKLGFRVSAIFPADKPSIAVLSGYGLRLRLVIGIDLEPGMLRLECHDPQLLSDTLCDAISNTKGKLTALNGTIIEIVETVDFDTPLILPAMKASFVVNKLTNDASWGLGRAGMRYRDLIPDRQGGRFIASHIQIPEGGLVSDYAHYHKIRFQMIYCYKGWVKVVYEDQGEPFILNAGDCVLQPPLIRHRVLESSEGLEVIEITSPSEHETLADLDIQLPTKGFKPDRDFGGQRFVRHQLAQTEWSSWQSPGFECRDLGIAQATDNLAQVQVVRLVKTAQSTEERAYFKRGNTVMTHHDHEFLFYFVLSGNMQLLSERHGVEQLSAGDSCVIPADFSYALQNCSNDLELLAINLP